MKTNRTSHGFTLMETVLAMAIIGVLAAVAVFSFSNVNKSTEFKNAGERLVADLELTRQQAIQEQAPYTVAFNIPQSSYTATGVEALKGTTNINTDLNDGLFGVTSMALNLQDVDDPTIGACQAFIGPLRNGYITRDWFWKVNILTDAIEYMRPTCQTQSRHKIDA